MDRWLNVRILLTIEIIHNLDRRYVAFVIVFPQADLYADVSIKLPFRFELVSENKRC